MRRPALGIPIGIAGKPVLHPGSQVRLGGAKQRVDVIGHPAKGKDFPAAAGNLLLESAGEAFVVTLIVKQGPSPIPSGAELIDGSGELNAVRAKHDQLSSTGALTDR